MKAPHLAPALLLLAAAAEIWDLVIGGCICLSVLLFKNSVHGVVGQVIASSWQDVCWDFFNIAAMTLLCGQLMLRWRIGSAPCDLLLLHIGLGPLSRPASWRSDKGIGRTASGQVRIRTTRGQSFMRQAACLTCNKLALC